MACACQEHLFLYKCSLSPTSLLQTENSFLRLRIKHKPRKAREFKLRADAAASVTPPELPHRLKGPMCRAPWKGKGVAWAEPRLRFGCVPLPFEQGLCSELLGRLWQSDRERLYHPHKHLHSHHLGASHVDPNPAELTHCGISLIRHWGRGCLSEWRGQTWRLLGFLHLNPKLEPRQFNWTPTKFPQADSQWRTISGDKKLEESGCKLSLSAGGFEVSDSLSWIH